jgi:hypothetical protein
MYICVSVFFIITNLCVLFESFNELRVIICWDVINKCNHVAQNAFFQFSSFVKHPYLVVQNELHF